MHPFLCLLTVLAQIAAGTSLFVCWQDAKKIRKSFFEFNAAMAAVVFLAVSARQLPLLSPFLIALAFAGGALWSFWREHFFRGKVFLKCAGLTGLTLGLYELGDSLGIFRNTPPSLAWVFMLQLAAGALLLGSVNGSMLLGHWYLIMRDLDFSHLIRAVRWFAWLLAFRAAALAAGLVLIRWTDPLFAHSFIGALLDPGQNLFFFVLRLFWGLLLPAVLAWMTMRCARSGSNQSATGLLYLAEVSVIIGEALAVSLRT